MALAVPASNVGPCMDVAAERRQGRQGRPGDAWPFSGISSSNRTTPARPATPTEPAKLLPPQEPWGFASAAGQEPTTGPRHDKATVFAPSRDPLTTNFGYPFRCGSSLLGLGVLSYYCHCWLAGHPRLISSILSTLFSHAAFFPCARPAPSIQSFFPYLPLTASPLSCCE